MRTQPRPGRGLGDGWGGAGVAFRASRGRESEGKMTIGRLLLELEQNGVELWLEGEKLRYRAPQGAVTERLRERVAQHKPELCALLQRAAQLALPPPLDAGSAELPLTPHQAWYLHTFDPEQHGWVITIALEVPWRVETERLRATAERLHAQHDALSLRLYKKPDGGWGQRMHGENAAPQLTVLELPGLTPNDERQAVQEAAHRVQASLSSLHGPLAAFLLCRFGEGRRDKIIFSLHHYAADGYSVHYFIQELLRIYQELSSNRPPATRVESATYKQYLLAVDAYTKKPTFLARALSFWLDPGCLRKVAPLPVDHPGGRHTDINSRRITIPLDINLKESISAYIAGHDDVSFNDLLLYAIASAYQRWTGQAWLRLDVDHNGRSGLLPGVELSGTLGPTTIKFPLLIELLPDEEAATALARIRQTIRATTANALGYGFLQYKCRDAAIREQLAVCAAPQVFLNNRATLQSGNTPSFDDIPKSLMDFPQPGVHENPVSYDLMIECDGFGSSILITWVYSSAIHREDTIRAFAESFFTALRTLTQGTRP